MVRTASFGWPWTAAPAEGLLEHCALRDGSAPGLRRSVDVWGAVFVPMVYYSYVSRGRRVRSREKAKKRISGESLLYGWVNGGEGEIYFESSTIKEISVAATCEARLLE